MKSLMLEFLANFWQLLNSIALFILLGVLIAGLFKWLLPADFIKKHLGQQGLIANLKAAFFGIPLPLCSCSVIPFVTALKNSGASRSAIQTFLISTPITGIDSIMATYAVFGWLFSVYRVLSSLIISLVAGLLTLLFIKPEQPQAVIQEKRFAQFKEVKHIVQLIPIKVLNDSEVQLNVVQKVLAHAFDDIFKDFAGSLMLGLLIGAVIMTLVPGDLVAFISSNPLLNYLLVLVVSVPLYVCATASIPLGFSLLSAGFSPGAAFIFLTAGPATNTITMSVVANSLGRASLVIYLSSVVLGSLLFAYLFDYFFADLSAAVISFDKVQEPAGFVAQVSSVVLVYLSLKYILNKQARLIKLAGSACSGGCCSGG